MPNISSYLNFQPSDGFGPVDVPGGQMSRTGSGMYMINVPGWVNSPVYFDPRGGQYYYTRQTGGIGPISEVKDPGWRDSVTQSFQGALNSPAVKQMQGGNQPQPDKALGSANIQGVGNVQLSQNAQGQTYYTQGGNRYALSPQQTEQLGLPSLAGYDQQGNPYYTPSQNPSQVQSTMQLPSSLTKADGNWSPDFVNWLKSNAGKNITVNGAATTVPTPGTPEAINWTKQLIDDVNNKHAAIGDSSGNSIYSASPPGAIGIHPKVVNPANPSDKNPTPEGSALSELQKTDPNLVNQINQLQQYYGTISKNQTDPTQTQAVQSYYNNQANALKNNTVLDPQALQQIQQADRSAQVARGNSVGTAPALQEAFNTGLEGIQLRQNMAQNINSYNQNQSQGVQSYLNSGLTPGAMGSRTLSDIINQANSANVGTPFQSTYNPQNTYTYLNPNSGAQFAQGANNWYNSANAQYLGSGASGYGQPNYLSSGINAGAGALSGALSGAALGSAVPGVGTAIGAIGGGLAGGLGGLGSSGLFGCWVAREVYGNNDPRWLVFRDWLAESAPSWVRKLYTNFGQKFAGFIRNKPFLKKIVRHYMDKALAYQFKKESRAAWYR